MNQILITGDERIKESINKQKKVLPVNGIIMFYAISIIILGISLISGSIYAKEKINSVVEANTKPSVEINRNDDDNTVEINVNHIRGIKTISYKWNEEKEKIIDAKNKKNVLEVIDLIGGINTLTVSITEENGQTVTHQKEYTVGNIPEIKLEAVSNGVKLRATSEEKIDYIEYNWDDEELQKIEVGDKLYEGIINAPKGEHILKIKVADINGMIADKEQPVVGDTEPTVNVTTELVDGKIAFIINAEDDEKISTVEITHNGGEKEVITVEEPKYKREIIMTQGEVNTLIVTVTNVNGLPKTRRVKYDNK